VIEDLDEAMQNKGGEDYTRLTGRPDFEGAFELLGSDAPEAEQFKAAYQEMARGYEQQKLDRVREIDMDYLRQKEHQRNVSRLIALLSPAPALTFLLTDAAGTGDLAYQNYRDAVMAHYQIIDREVYSKRRSQRYQIRLGGSSISSNFGGGSDVDLEAVPAFTIKEPELRNVLRENAWALATILIYLVVPFVVAYVAFLRYDVR
jgi:hypothetical protein